MNITRWAYAHGTMVKHPDGEWVRRADVDGMLRELEDRMMALVKWQPCDCGCPSQRSPADPWSVTWIRAAQQVQIARKGGAE